ncbi:hypothetical protein POL68_37445 [Stigmatella sp. ncwal1]|uniref:Uncharacterized protein n=1 Tax=Stigmatella ashevillensis TaxID=2995309 RepID=A0ABT5DKL3_9BACT|nr:hypothetical protein [Stigmatella ashevillena]MDC0714209.1 hypothetical protein [Stigmatella ashevillena]
MRNPDYLANELLNEYELHHDPALLLKAREIFESREPDLRRVPMVRYLFGAFEPLDEGLALLRTHDFVRIRRVGVPGAHIREHLYLVTKDGRTALDKLAAMGPELAWYRQRAVLVAQVAGGAGGKALKDRQYLQQEYAGTALKKVIAPITDRVRLRMEGLLSGVHP